MIDGSRKAELGVISLGLAVGLAWAIVVFVTGILAGLFGWGLVFVHVMSSLYLGYGPSIIGSVAGAVWALACGLLLGVLIGWFYNLCLRSRR